MSLYSWCGTPVQFDVPDEIATSYNKIIDELHKVSDLKEMHQIVLQASAADLENYNKVAMLINSIIELNGGFLPYHDTQSDYLVKMEDV